MLFFLEHFISLEVNTFGNGSKSLGKSYQMCIRSGITVFMSSELHAVYVGMCRTATILQERESLFTSENSLLSNWSITFP